MTFSNKENLICKIACAKFTNKLPSKVVTFQEINQRLGKHNNLFRKICRATEAIHEDLNIHSNISN